MRKKVSKKTAKRIAVTAITAALYTVINLIMPFPEYGIIQLRLSEVMNLLAFINPVFAPGIIVGCFITNLFSPFVIDWIVGTFATAVTMFFVTRSKTLFVASLWPTFFCFIIGAEIVFLAGPPFLLSEFIFTTLSIMAGEFIAMTIVGYPLFKYLMKNEKLMQLLKSF